MKNTYKIILVAVMIVLFTSCKNKWGWQPISSDHESTLNIYALLFVGDNISENSYYINVHQSLNLQQDIDVHVGNDTTWYGLNSLYDYYITAITKSAYIVEDAKVQIIDGVDTTNFYFTPPHYLEEYGRITHAAYWDTTRQFKPQPNREYTLKISTPDGQSVVGTIKTPNIPNIIDEQVADTLFNNRTFTITFNKVADDQHLRIKMRPAEEYTWLCGVEREYVIQNNSDTTWTSSVKSCSDILGDYYENDTTIVSISLEAMDSNFYEYFVKNAGEVEYINILAGIEGNSGFSAGIEGGYGVFGAIAVDKIERVYVP